MAKNTTKPPAEQSDAWVDDNIDISDDASNDAPEQVVGDTRILMRHRIEDLLEKRRLERLIADYDAYEVDDEKAM
jgi:hypothetical protein